MFRSISCKMCQALVSRNSAKTLSWMIVSGIVICLSVGISTGQWWAAFIGTVWSCLTKMPVYSVHDWVWDHLWPKQSRSYQTCSCSLQEAV
jgi:hypothetical protein